MKLIAINFALFLYTYYSMKHAIHAYQQNRYQKERYLFWIQQAGKHWLKEHLKIVCLCIPIVALCFISEDTSFWLYCSVLCILSYIFYRMEQETEYIQPLVYTARVKRLLQMCTCIHFIIFSFLYLCFPFTLLLLMTPIYYFMVWFTLLPASTILQPLERHIRMFYVNDAKYKLKKHTQLTTVGITGSYGKTSIKNIGQHFLQEQYLTLATPHSYNNLMGITLTIRKYLKTMHEVFLCEMGTDHAGELNELTQLVPLDYAIVCAIGPQHLQTFHTMEAIINEKMSLARSLDQYGTAILNIDYDAIRNNMQGLACNVITYGEHEDADYRLLHIAYSSKGTSFEILHDGKQYAFHTKLLGKHNISNLTCAIALAHSMHLPFTSLAYSCMTMPYVEHRLQMIRKETYTLLDDSYNSNPIGAKNALEVLKQMPSPRMIMTPGFLDLGDMARQKHQEYARQIVDACDEIILIGRKQCKDIIEELHRCNVDSSIIHVVESTKEAFLVMEQRMQPQGCALIENDLPDIFNH